MLPKSKQGRFVRERVLWRNEELSKLAKRYVQNNFSVKGKPNMTTHDFFVWVNTTLPRKVSVSTCRRWLSGMRFEVITPRKGVFIDGHERADARTAYLRFVNLLNAPTDESRSAIPTDIEPQTADKREKTVFLFHDESIFHSNDLKWGIKGEKIMKGKSKGAGIMVSDFIHEKNVFLLLSETEYEEAKK